MSRSRSPRPAGASPPRRAPDRCGPLIRVLCAPNAFKGTLTAFDAAAAMAAGVRSAVDAVEEQPVADGGDGTLDVLLAAAGPAARSTRHDVTGPLGATTSARLGWLDDERAVVELAEAVGLRKLAGSHDPLAASSQGAGELILAALGGGARSILVGVGGSATTDAGAGLLKALGARLLDSRGAELAGGGGALTRLERVDLFGVREILAGCRLEVVVDVRSPLYGPDGAAHVFGPQKGASSAEVAVLDAGLRRFAEVAERDLGAAGLALRPGAGAAGGAAYGLGLIGAELRPGAALVCDVVGLDRRIERADLVLTGEGRLDSQTAAGKAPAEVAERARLRGVPCIAIAGSVADPLGGLFDAVYALSDLPGTGDTRRDAAALVSRAARAAVQDFSKAQSQ